MHFKLNLQAETAGILEQITFVINILCFHMQALRICNIFHLKRQVLEI